MDRLNTPDDNLGQMNGKYRGMSKLLRHYENADYATQLRVRFIYWLSIFLIAGIFLTLSFTFYINLTSISRIISIKIIVAQLALLLVFLGGFLLIYRGFFRWTVHLLQLSVLICIWFVMFTDDSGLLIRLDSAILIVASLSMLPLLIQKNRYLFLFYVAGNVLMLMVLIRVLYPRQEMTQEMALDFLVDSIMAVIFTGIIGYNTFRINNFSLQQAETTIREKELTEEALASSERKYREMIEFLPQVFYETDAQWNLTYTNRNAYKVFGYTEEDIQRGLNIFSIVDPRDRQRMEGNLQKMLNGEPMQGMEYTLFCKDGSSVAVQSFISLIKVNEQVAGIRGIVIDISSRLKTEKELLQSEGKYRTLMENLNEVVMMVDHDDRIRFVNKKFTEKLGYTPEEVLGEIGYLKLLDPADYDVIRKANEERKQQISSQYELGFVAKNGQKIDFLISGAPLIDAEGTNIGSIGTMTDITERKKAEKALRESEDRFKSLIELVPFEIILTDLAGKIILVNNAFSAAHRYKTEDLTGKSLEDFPVIFDPEIRQTIQDSLMQKGYAENIEFCLTSEDGKPSYFYYTGRIIQMEGKPVILSTTFNITEKKKNEQELESYRRNLELLVKERTEELTATNEELISVNEQLVSQREALQNALNELHLTQNHLVESEKMASLGILAAGVAHEINNPLNFIHGGITGIESYFEEKLGEHYHQVAPLIQGIHVGVERASKIVTSLNHFSRTNDNIQENCDIHEILENCLTMLHYRFNDRIRIERDYIPGSISIRGNEGKLHQAFLNVLSNAYQSIKKQGIITIRTWIEGQMAAVSISDTGSGISNENLSKIFNPFFTTKDPGQGTGLGLSITYNIIQEHEGVIQFLSDEGEGTTAFIRLPFKG